MGTRCPFTVSVAALSSYNRKTASCFALNLPGRGRALPSFIGSTRSSAPGIPESPRRGAGICKRRSAYCIRQVSLQFNLVQALTPEEHLEWSALLTLA